jgi:hypothetical protein
LNTILLYNQEGYEMNDDFMKLTISKGIVKKWIEYSVKYPYKILFKQIQQNLPCVYVCGIVSITDVALVDGWRDNDD